MNATLVEFRRVRLGYGRHTVLSDLDLRLVRGDYLGLVGPNGAGKTTLLRALLGNLRALRGEILYPEGQRPRFGYVPQREGVDEAFPFSVEDVTLMGRYPRMGLVHRPTRSDRDFARHCLERVGMADHRHRSLGDLSGGQKQRVLMARALAGEPEVLLLDEPTTGMDLASEEDTLHLIGDLHEQGMTVVMVTHLLYLVANHARTVGILHHGLTVGPVEEVLDETRLSRLYGRPVRVTRVGRRRFVHGVLPSDEEEPAC